MFVRINQLIQIVIVIFRAQTETLAEILIGVQGYFLQRH